MLLFGFFEFTHHCRRCIKLTLQFSLQFGDLLFERLNFLVIAFRVGDYFGLGGFVRFFLCGRVLQFIVAFFCCLRGLLFSLCFVGFFKVFLSWLCGHFFDWRLCGYLHHPFFVKVIKDFPVAVSVFELNITVCQGGKAVGTGFLYIDLAMFFAPLDYFLSIHKLGSVCLRGTYHVANLFINCLEINSEFFQEFSRLLMNGEILTDYNRNNFERVTILILFVPIMLLFESVVFIKIPSYSNIQINLNFVDHNADVRFSPVFQPVVVVFADFSGLISLIYLLLYIVIIIDQFGVIFVYLYRRNLRSDVFYLYTCICIFDFKYIFVLLLYFLIQCRQVIFVDNFYFYLTINFEYTIYEYIKKQKCMQLCYFTFLVVNSYIISKKQYFITINLTFITIL
ncbi:Hypothetical_protein [Hexamita inflata]|uniref:Hypothetical_protein n=1 Tax=Hexamita inflata TaxID=28002 RepID=A0AA86RT79_9EUKA|nr:Hypothetical protein HINF_LOCUS65184 [Hexamita inflata]